VLKRCTKCGEEKAEDNFYRGERYKGGIRPQCKGCLGEADARRRRRTPEEVEAGRRERAAAPGMKRCSGCRGVVVVGCFGSDRRHPDGLKSRCQGCCRADMRAARVVRGDEGRARERDSYRANPGPKRGRSRSYRERNLGRVREGRRREYEKHRERYRMSALAWRRDHPAEVRRNRRARRARVMRAPGTHTAQQAEERLALWGWRCWLCGSEATAVDHVKPLARGGADFACNLRGVCGPCNSRKNSKWAGPHLAHQRVFEAPAEAACA